MQLVFIHGTLRRGENDYPHWLADPDEVLFVADAVTTSRFPFFVHLLPRFPDCSPCVLNAPDATAACRQVEGELFLVSARALAWLDVLMCVAEGLHRPGRVGVTVLSRLECLSESTTSLLAATAAEPLLYFRHAAYAADWQEAHPRDCSPLISRFSAAVCLASHGARFDGSPAHLRGGTLAREMFAARLRQLPAHLRPSTTLAVAGEPPLGAPLLPKPIVLFIIDGVGDNTYTELGSRTPLEVVAGVPVPAPAAASDSPDVSSGVMATEVVLDGAEEADLLAGSVSDGINCVTRSGASGLMDPYMAGVSCGSDTAHLSMFGYPPTQYYRGRGAYEALGAGLLLDDEDVAFKSNFATWQDPEEEGLETEGQVPASASATCGEGAGQLVTHRRCDRNFTQEGPLLCRDLNGTIVPTDLQGVPFEYPHVIKIQYATEHRCGVALSGAITKTIQLPDGSTETRVLGMLSDKITGTDPLKDNQLLTRCVPTVGPDHPEYASALYTSRLVEAASATLSRLLKVHPINAARRAANKSADSNALSARKQVANLILFRGAAKKGWVPSFTARHGLSGSIVAPTCIIKGLGLCCGLRSRICDVCHPVGSNGLDPLSGATGDYHSDLEVKVDAVLHALRVQCPNSHFQRVAGEAASAAPLESSEPHVTAVILHVKGVDDAGHDKSLRHKLEMLRRCGCSMQRLWDALPVGSTMAVVADHSTPLALGDHSCEPVPVSVATKGCSGSGAFGDGVRYYSEVCAAGGGLGRFRGEELMPLLKRANSYYHYQY